MRCPIPSRSIVTLTGSFFSLSLPFSPSLALSPSLPFSPSLFLSASLPLSPLPESFFSSAAFSSSLCGSTGEGSPLLSTAAYTLRRTGCWKLDKSSQPAESPTSVLTAKNSDFPPLSNTGYRASLIPSVICDSFPLSNENTKTARKWFSSSLAYVSHLLSGDQVSPKPDVGSS